MRMGSYVLSHVTTASEDIVFMAQY